MDGRWRGGGDGDGDDLPFNPHPGRVPEQELLVPELGFEEAVALCIFFGKMIGGSGVFRSDEVNRRKGASPAEPPPGQVGPRHGQPWAAARWRLGAVAGSRSPPSGSVGLLQKYNF